MSEKHEIDCWNCHATTSLVDRSEFDGCCWGCGEELDLEPYLIKAIGERDQLRADVEREQAYREILQAANAGLTEKAERLGAEVEALRRDAELGRLSRRIVSELQDSPKSALFSLTRAVEEIDAAMAGEE